MEANTRIATPLARSWLKSLSRVRSHELQGFWAIADQGVVSLGNFLTTIILARSISPADYGVWSVLFGSILFLNVLPASLITYPLSVRLASRDDGTEGQLILAALAMTGVLALPQTLVLFAIAAWIGGSGLALWASLGLLLWQLQETTRRILMARLAFRAALLTDAISYLGQAGLFWLFARSGRLSPEIGFALLGLTCGLAGIAQLLLIRKLLRVSITQSVNVRVCTRTFWATGRWILGTNLLTNFSIQSVPWALFLLRGPAEAASFQAISNLLGVSHPIVLSLGNIVVPAAARARVQDGLRAARRVALRHVTQGGLLLLPYVAALLIFPRQLLGLFYSSSSPYLLLDSPLRLFTVIYVLNYFSMTLRFLLNALEEKNRVQFVVELCGSLSLGGLLVLLVLWLGMSGAILATGLWAVARLTSNLLILRQVKA
jgi:O-antigen/teichoic acid export membrane protein